MPSRSARAATPPWRAAVTVALLGALVVPAPRLLAQPGAAQPDGARPVRANWALANRFTAAALR
ncbi:MAG: hypothetical protein RLZ32_787, partial [Gemmatimonadota bacterium]